MTVLYISVIEGEAPHVRCSVCRWSTYLRHRERVDQLVARCEAHAHTHGAPAGDVVEFSDRPRARVISEGHGQ